MMSSGGRSTAPATILVDNHNSLKRSVAATLANLRQPPPEHPTRRETESDPGGGGGGAFIPNQISSSSRLKDFSFEEPQTWHRARLRSSDGSRRLRSRYSESLGAWSSAERSARGAPTGARSRPSQWTGAGRTSVPARHSPLQYPAEFRRDAQDH